MHLDRLQQRTEGGVLMREFDAGEVLERFHAICAALDIRFPKKFSWRLNPASLSCPGDKEVRWVPKNRSESYRGRLDQLDLRPPVGFYDIADVLETCWLHPPINIQVDLSSYYGSSVYVEPDEDSWGAVYDALGRIEGELLAMIEAEWHRHTTDRQEEGI